MGSNAATVHRRVSSALGAIGIACLTAPMSFAQAPVSNPSTTPQTSAPAFPAGAESTAPTLQFPAPVKPTVQSPGLPGWGPNGKPLYYLLVFSNATPGADVEFNLWYDRIHAPLVIESGDFVWAQRFQLSPAQVAGGELATRRYLVIFAIETDDIAKTAAEANQRLRLPRNIRSMTLDYSSLLSVTVGALGPPITQKQAKELLAEEEAAGRVPRSSPAKKN